jgi:hypothetical protein
LGSTAAALDDPTDDDGQREEREIKNDATHAQCATNLTVNHALK